MSRKVALVVCLSVFLALAPGVAHAGPGAHPAGSGGEPFLPGAPGAGDPYFPLDGNGGYDVGHYLLDLDYDPTTDVLSGTATITARATQNLSSFNLDFDGLTVRSIEINGRPAEWSRDGAELTVTPKRGLRNHTRFTAVVTYDGVPETLSDGSGFFHTDDGALVAGQPHVAATWFPVNDHPIDKAAYTFELTAPAGLEVVSNGVLRQSRTRDGWTTWTWDAKEPMASYLATMAVGEFDVRAYRHDGLRFWDALDPDLFDPVEPRTGDQFALSQVGDLSYKRLARTISVPAAGRSCRSGSPGTRRPTGTSRSSRRTPSGRTTGRLCPTSTATLARTPETRAPSGCLCTRSSGTIRPTTATARVPPRGRVVRGGPPAAAAMATSSGRSTSPPMPEPTSRCRSATPATTSCS